MIGRVPALGLAVIAVGACRAEAPDALERARAQGLRAGFAIEPPYALVDSNGAVTGESPEVLRRVAAMNGIDRLQWVPLEFDQLIPALEAGRIDVIAAGLFVTPGRRTRVRFSRPIGCARPVLVLSRSRSSDARRARSGSCDECRIAVLDGSVEQAALSADSAALGGPLVVPDLATAAAALRGGAADAFAISAPTARLLIGRDSTLTVGPATLPERVAARASGCWALAFRQGDSSLVAAIDEVLGGWLGSPEHLELAARFGFSKEELACGGGGPRCVVKRREVNGS